MSMFHHRYLAKLGLGLSALAAACLFIGITATPVDAMTNKNRMNTEGNLAHFCELAGFGYERHDVVTDDGYILQMYRVVPRSSQNAGESSGSESSEQELQAVGSHPHTQAQRPALLLQHGLATDMLQWVFQAEYDATVAPAFVFA